MARVRTENTSRMHPISTRTSWAAARSGRSLLPKVELQRIFTSAILPVALSRILAIFAMLVSSFIACTGLLAGWLAPLASSSSKQPSKLPISPRGGEVPKSVKSPNPNDPGPYKIRTYLIKKKMTARIVRF